jgi:hypothetical protein
VSGAAGARSATATVSRLRALLRAGPARQSFARRRPGLVN